MPTPRPRRDPPPKRAGDTAWHPLLDAQERTTGVWTLVDSTGRDYGVVRIVREGNAVVYTGELRGQRLSGRNVTLRDAVAKVHLAFVHSFNPTPIRARDDDGWRRGTR